MIITDDHKRAMLCLPFNGDWKLEAQLIGLTGLKDKTRPIFRDLVRAGFCQQGRIATQRGLVASGDTVRQYCCPVAMRSIYNQALKEQNG